MLSPPRLAYGGFTLSMKSGAVHDLVLVNVAEQPVRPAIYFYDKAGGLIDPESVVDVIGDLEVTEYGALTLQGGLHPLGEVTLATRGRGETATGSVKMVSDGPNSLIGAALRFDLPGALVHESELARNEPDSQVHHLPRAYDDGLPSSAIRLRM